MTSRTKLLIFQVFVIWGAIYFATQSIDSNLAFCVIWAAMYLELGHVSRKL